MSSLDDSLADDGVESALAASPSAYAGSSGEEGPAASVEAPVSPPRRAHRVEPVEVPLRRALEAILFATDRPVSIEQLLCALPGRAAEEVETELVRMEQDYEEHGFGFRLFSRGGFQIRTDPAMHEYVTRFLVGKKRTRLSRAAMETLAIIAYRQPITRGECEEIRGVDSGQVLHTLLERNLVTFRGRSQALGRPHLYGTTDEFLRYFGLASLADLPSPEELQALLGEDPLSDPEIVSALERSGFAEPVATGEGQDGGALDGDGDGEEIELDVLAADDSDDLPPLESVYVEEGIRGALRFSDDAEPEGPALSAG